MKNSVQLQATVQESVQALEAFESLIRSLIPVAERYAAIMVETDPVSAGVRTLINSSKEALERWAK